MAAAVVRGASGGARRMAERLREQRRSEEPPKPATDHQSLRSRVIYRGKDLVLIDKPYGLPVHGGPGVKHSLDSMLPTLSQMLFGRDEEPLRICHRLDKDTSGALILARSADAADRVQQALREHRVHRVYWALCLGVSDPLAGIVDIPIIEKETPGPQKHYKMALCPRFRVSSDGSVQRFRVSRSAHEAVTHYRTLYKASGVSLLELKPLTGVKHQLRTHLALGLSCPILGDHKYSHWGRLAPQVLPPALLSALEIKQSQVRSLRIHLHAAQISLRLSSEAPPLILGCPLPKHFLNTLRKLRIAFPRLQDIENDDTSR